MLFRSAGLSIAHRRVAAKCWNSKANIEAQHYRGTARKVIILGAGRVFPALWRFVGHMRKDEGLRAKVGIYGGAARVRAPLGRAAGWGESEDATSRA